MSDFKNYTDSELWELIRDDNYKAFDELFNRYWKILLNIAYKRVGTKEVCQDLIQEVFLSIWLRRAELTIENPAAFLKTALRYRVYTYYSRNKFSKEFLEVFENITDCNLNADENLKYKELKLVIRAWIESLPPKRRQIFKLYIEENLSTLEISQELNITRKTVQNQLNRSFGSLKDKLSGSFSFLMLF